MSVAPREGGAAIGIVQGCQHPPRSRGGGDGVAGLASVDGTR